MILLNRFQPDPQAFNYLAPENKCYCVSPANCTGIYKYFTYVHPTVHPYPHNDVFYISPCTYRAKRYELYLTILDNGVFYVSPCTYRASLYELCLTILDNGVFYVSPCKCRAPLYELYLNILDNGVFYISSCKYRATLTMLDYSR